jgi:hypothetical protein
MYLRVAKIRTFAGKTPLTNATGFFYQHDDFLYLVTSLHVVINETTLHRPDRLSLSLHVDAKHLQRRDETSIPLYVDGLPQWYQHSRCRAADVVAVAVNDPHLLCNHCISPFRSDDIVNMGEVMPMGQDVLILGFPLGFHDTVHNLPIVRSAILASSFSHPFNGEPYFLTDARLHRGMSGSPVIVRSTSQYDDSAGHAPETKWRLLGIHSSSLDVSDRDPNQDERLGLNTALYASLLPEMLPSRLKVPAGAGLDALANR